MSSIKRMIKILEDEGYMVVKNSWLSSSDVALKGTSTKEQVDLLDYISYSLGTKISIDYCLNGILVTYDGVETLYDNLNEAFIGLIEPLTSEEPTPEIENCIRKISTLAESGNLQYTISRAVIKCIDTGVVEDFYARYDMQMKDIFKLNCVRDFIADNPSSEYEVRCDLFKLGLNKVKVLNMDALINIIKQGVFEHDDMNCTLIKHYSDRLKRFDSSIGICTFVGGDKTESFSYSI